MFLPRFCINTEFALVLRGEISFFTLKSITNYVLIQNRVIFPLLKAELLSKRFLFLYCEDNETFIDTHEDLIYIILCLGGPCRESVFTQVQFNKETL